MRFKSIVKLILINLLVLLLLSELGSMAYIHFSKPDIGYKSTLPTYIDFSWKDSFEHRHDPQSPHFIDTTYKWSTWHPRNAVYRHKMSCFDVLMRFNNDGIRGVMPSADDTSTVLFLGDSFTEGFGLPEDSTLPVLMAGYWKVPTLNLGVSGHIGTTQHSMIYEHFGPRFRHRKVVVQLYLLNDFLENDVRKYESAFKGTRYRPYRADTSRPEEIVYKGSLQDNQYSWAKYYRYKEDGNKRLVKYGLPSFFREYGNNHIQRIFSLTYLSRMFYVLKNRLAAAQEKSAPLPPELKYDAYDLNLLDYDLRRIMKTAESFGASVTFVNIPSDVLLSQAAADPQIAERYQELERHIAQVTGNERHRYLSFYEEIRSQKWSLESLFFGCDPHLHGRGMDRLARFIYQSQQSNTRP
jgi:lysophospholipase L1-like esterase